MPNPSGTLLAAEVASQPQDWRRTAARRADVDRLPAAGLRVAAVGCGTSFYMAQAYAALRETSGQGLTDAWSCSEDRLDRGYDHVVVICRSGTTTEVVEVVDRLVAAGVPHTALVATAGTPVADRAQQVILLDDVDEQSVVQTRFATSVLALLRAHLGEDVGPLADAAAAVLAEPEDVALADLRGVEQLTFVGSGWAAALANEAALKLRESAQFWTESYPAMEYRHGPISIAAPDRAVWALGPVPTGLEAQVRATGAHFEHRDSDPLVELVRVHRLCEAMASDRGLDPDHPRHLARSIILT